MFWNFLTLGHGLGISVAKVTQPESLGALRRIKHLQILSSGL